MLAGPKMDSESASWVVFGKTGNSFADGAQQSAEIPARLLGSWASEVLYPIFKHFPNNSWFLDHPKLLLNYLHENKKEPHYLLIPMEPHSAKGLLEGEFLEIINSCRIWHVLMYT